MAYPLDNTIIKHRGYRPSVCLRDFGITLTGDDRSIKDKVTAAIHTAAVFSTNGQDSLIIYLYDIPILLLW